MGDRYEPYRDLARTFGLAMRPWDVPLTAGQLRLDGVVLGQRVAITRTIGKHPLVTFRAAIEPALDLGLVVRRAGVVASVQELLGAEDVTTGDAAFDAAFAVRADEPERARGLLDAAVRAELAEVADDLIARDGEVLLEVPLDHAWWRSGFRYPDRDAPWLVAGTRRVAGVAAALDRARAGCRPSGSDVVLDDAPFDAAFDVRTDAPERLRAALDTPIRAELLAVGTGGRLELDRWGLRVDTPAAEVDVDALPLLVERLAELVAALARGANDRGAGYR